MFTKFWFGCRRPPPTWRSTSLSGSDRISSGIWRNFQRYPEFSAASGGIFATAGRVPGLFWCHIFIAFGQIHRLVWRLSLDVHWERLQAHHAHFAETRVHAKAACEGRRDACDARPDVNGAHPVRWSIAPGCYALPLEACDGGTYRTVGRQRIGRAGVRLWESTQVD